jgi:arylsulfatase
MSVVRSTVRLLVGAFLALALVACDAKPAGGTAKLVIPTAKKPNVIIIVVDTLRADRLGCYGHGGGLTPTMDKIASEGARVERAFSSAPWTLPSVASLLVSFNPSVHKAISYREVEAARKAQTEITVLSDDFRTLPELFHAAGYQTAAIAANPFVQAQYGFGQGFDFFVNDVRENGEKGSAINKSLAAWLARDRDASKPVFLYLHYMDPHGPYDAPREIVEPLMQAMQANPNKTALTAAQRQMLVPQNYLRKKPPAEYDPTLYERFQGYREYWTAGYEACIKEGDNYLAKAEAMLREAKLWDDAIIVLTSDHGEAFAEHGYWEHGPGQHQTQLHVPLLIRWKGVIPPGVVRGNASLLDVLPTLAELASLGAVADVQGRSLVSRLAGAPQAEPYGVFAECVKVGTYAEEAIAFDNWKLIRRRTPERRDRSGAVQPAMTQVWLYDLSKDAGEENDQSQAKPAIVKDLLAKMDTQYSINGSTKPGVVVRTASVSKKVSDKLAASGYVGDKKEPISTSAPAAPDPPPDAEPENDAAPVTKP